MLVGILASSHPHIHRFMYCGCLLISSHLHIIISLHYHIRISISLVSCTPGTRILTLSYSPLHILSFMYSGCLLVSSHPHILISLGSCTSDTYWYLHILIPLGSCTPGARWYPRILTFSYPQCSSWLENWNRMKIIVLTKKPQRLWKQIMALTNF